MASCYAHAWEGFWFGEGSRCGSCWEKAPVVGVVGGGYNDCPVYNRGLLTLSGDRRETVDPKFCNSLVKGWYFLKNVSL